MKERQRKKWSVLVYMAADAADHKLAKAAYFDLEQMRAAGSSAEVYVAAQADLSHVTTRRYIYPEISKHSANDMQDVIELDRKVNSASMSSLREFFEWGARECPAENILVILWGHGFGLDDWDPFADKAEDDKSDEEDEDRAMVTTSPQSSLLANFREKANYFPAWQWSAITNFQQSALPENGTPPKASANVSAITHVSTQSGLNKGSVLLNAEIASVLAECRSNLPEGENLAILGFDCCDMSMLEVWYQMASCADRGIGSQYGIPFKGWPYQAFIQELLKKPEMDSDELCRTIVDTYVKSNDKPYGGLVLTLSACDLTKVETLTPAIRRLANDLTDASRFANGRFRIFGARNQSPIYDQDGFIDLAGFCRLLQFNFPGSALADACDGVISVLRNYIVSSGFTPTDTTKKISLSNGVSVWIPAWIQYPDADIRQRRKSEDYLLNGCYSETEFAKQTGWDKFLEALLRNTRLKQKGS